VVYICNPSYSRGREQEEHGSKQALTNSSYLEKTHHKKGLVEWLQGIGLEFKPQYCKTN
jgi:hypothetical protein